MLTMRRANLQQVDWPKDINLEQTVKGLVNASMSGVAGCSCMALQLP